MSNAGRPAAPGGQDETCPAAPGPSPGSGRGLCLSTNNGREAPDTRSSAIDGNCEEQHEMLPRDYWRVEPARGGLGRVAS